jgi:uncharacterized protein YjbI with pentapeptide repeats
MSFKLLLSLNDPRQQAISDTSTYRDTEPMICTIPVYLCNAEFDGQVEFSYCTFKRAFNLSGAVFRKEVLFRETVFEDKFYPRNTKFHDNVSFWKTKFINPDFHDTLFKDKANFRNSKFERRTRFRNVKFQDKANFVHTKFYGKTEFLGCTFREAFFSPDVLFNRRTELKYVVFENGEKIAFMTKDLSNVSFMNTDVTRVRFDRFKVIDERELEVKERDEEYPNKQYLFVWDEMLELKYVERIRTFLRIKFDVAIPEATRFVKVDEGVISNKTKQWTNSKGSYSFEFPREENDGIAIIVITLSDVQRTASLRINYKLYYNFMVEQKNSKKYIYYWESLDIDGIKAIYRNLRENYEYRLRYDEAGQFFIREMELKRKYHIDRLGQIRKTDWFRRNFSLTGFYRLASYGEKFRMPVIFGLAVFAISMLFWLQEFQFIDELSFSTEILKPLSNVTERTSTVFLQLRGANLIWFDYLVKALGIFSLGLLAIPLRRKFERKFRH